MSRPKGKKPSVRLSVSVSATDHAELARFAEASDLSLAWVVRRAISDFVERHRNDMQGELHLPRGRSPEERVP
jgi:predicted transcriptional regulator